MQAAFNICYQYMFHLLTVLFKVDSGSIPELETEFKNIVRIQFVSIAHLYTKNFMYSFAAFPCKYFDCNNVDCRFETSMPHLHFTILKGKVYAYVVFCVRRRF